MPLFDTPQPVAVTVQIDVGDVRVAAEDRRDTLVEVHPSNAAKRADVTAAEQATVDHVDGRLRVRTPRTWRRYTPFGEGGSIDVRIAVPTGSQLTVDAQVAGVHCTGTLGECSITVASGEVRVDAAGPAHLRTGSGDVSLTRARGRAEISTGSGAVRVAAVDGDVVVKNSNGDSWVGAVTGEGRLRAANGDITIDRSGPSVTAKTANGDVRVHRIDRGTVSAECGCGRIEVGIAEGTAAWLDLLSAHGQVRHDLDQGDPPAAGDSVVEVRARTAAGDITIHRSHRSTAAAGAGG